MTEEWNPPVAFYFSIEFSKGSEIFHMEFKEVSGLQTDFEIEEVKKLTPVRIKHPNFICKRTLYPLLEDNGLFKWVKETLEGDSSKPIKTKDLFIYLLDSEGNKIVAWSVFRVYPVKWEIEPFKSANNELAIESIEFAHSGMKRVL